MLCSLCPPQHLSQHSVSRSFMPTLGRILSNVVRKTPWQSLHFPLLAFIPFLISLNSLAHSLTLTRPSHHLPVSQSHASCLPHPSHLSPFPQLCWYHPAGFRDPDVQSREVRLRTPQGFKQLRSRSSKLNTRGN